MYVSLLSTLRSSPELELVKPRQNARPGRAKAGTSLYYEGDPVERLYQVKTGVLRLTRLLEDGRRQVIAFGYPGDIVGFPSDGLHHTDCETLVDTTFVSHAGSALDPEHGDPELHQELVRSALREIAAMQDHFMMLGQKSSVEKVAAFLCTLTDRVGDYRDNCLQVELPMFFGLTTETVSRTLTHLRKRGVIRIANIHTVIVLQPEELIHLSVGDELDLAS